MASPGAAFDHANGKAKAKAGLKDRRRAFVAFVDWHRSFYTKAELHWWVKAAETAPNKRGITGRQMRIKVGFDQILKWQCPWIKWVVFYIYTPCIRKMQCFNIYRSFYQGHLIQLLIDANVWWQSNSSSWIYLGK